MNPSENRVSLGLAGLIVNFLLLCLTLGCGKVGASKNSVNADPIVLTPGTLEVDGRRDAGSEKSVSINEYMGQKQVQIVVRNVSSLPVTVQEVRTSCFCVVADEISSKVLQPGQEMPIRLDVSIPEYGIIEQMVYVTCDRMRKPAQCSLTIRGKRDVPVVDSALEVTVPFLRLRVGDQKEFSIVTHEDSQKAPWFKAMECDISGCKLELLRIGETAEGSLMVKREYFVRATWSSPPQADRGFASIYGDMAEQNARVNVGSLIWKVPENLLFSPSSIHLSANRTEDLVVFADVVGQEAWEINELKHIPRWLKAEWVAKSTRRMLRISVNRPYIQNTRHEYTMELLNKVSNERGSLTIIYGFLAQ